MLTRRAFLLSTATAIAAPLAVRAQMATKSFRISFLALTPGEDRTLMPALIERLHELGYEKAKNMAFEYRSADGRPEQLPALARELVAARPNIDSGLRDIDGRSA